jgi:GT2 family glycosyltransferase/glycosyltransferase involved in cell wall biosynthesis
MTSHRDHAKWLLSGSGLEIGALDRPLPLCADCHVTYADRLDSAQLTETFTKISVAQLPSIDHVFDLDQDGLTNFQDDGFDFVILNDILPHLANPLFTLAEVFRCVRKNGMVVVSAHDKRFSRDARLAAPAFVELLYAWQEGKNTISDYAYREFLRVSNSLLFWDGEEKVTAALTQARLRNEVINAWDSDEFAQFLHDALAVLSINAFCCYVSHGNQNGSEYFSVWQKKSAGDQGERALPILMSRLAEHEHRQAQTEWQLEQQLLTAQRHISDQDKLLTDLRGSSSWRLTRPLRAVKRLFRLLRRVNDKSGRAIFNQHRVMHGWRQAFFIGLADAYHAPVTASEPRSIAPIEAMMPVQQDRSPNTRYEAVDIVVCVHNALADVQGCLSSILRQTLPPYRLILVDDGSDTATAEYLTNFARSQNAHLIRNEVARGYTCAANQGLRCSTAEFVLLLNSDTLTTPNWLDRLMLCACSDPTIGMVGPLSNTASWQSIPELEVDGDWAENALPDNLTADEMALRIACRSGRLYPRMPFLNGFCLLLKRAVITDIGYFDEETFARGYGEENDYCLRARQRGWQLALVDDAYVYHAQSKSYSHARRKELAGAAGKALCAKHGGEIIAEGVAFCREDRILQGLRARARILLARETWIEKGCARWEGRSVLFLLPMTIAGGGANVVISEARAMLAMGVDVRLLNLERMRHIFELSYPQLELPVHYVTSETQVPELSRNFDAVVATINFTVNWLSQQPRSMTKTRFGYYIQDFEPWFYLPEAPEYQIAMASYNAIQGLHCFTKTTWNRDVVLKETGVTCSLVGPSFDVDLFMPRRRQENGNANSRLRIGAMVRPDSERRAPLRTMKILQAIKQIHGNTVEIVIFGTWRDNPAFLALPQNFDFACAGELTPPQMASLLNELDIFADFSHYQAMGLTGMEAMSCGVAVVLPARGGASSFARHEENALLIDTTSDSACQAALERLISDEPLRSRLQTQALLDVVQYYPEQAAFRILQTLFGDASDVADICQ